MRRARSDENFDDLARRMVALEEEAYQDFADIFGPRFKALFLRRGLPLSEAEALSVSSITDIALKVGKYRPMELGSFEAWVMTLARRYLINWWRSKPQELPYLDELATELTPEDADEPNAELVNSVRDALEQLQEVDRQIVQLRNLNIEQSYAEIGQSLGLRTGTVRVRHFRALKKLETILGSDQRVHKYIRHEDAINVKRNYEQERRKTD